jgi:hypothetical protein
VVVAVVVESILARLADDLSLSVVADRFNDVVVETLSLSTVVGLSSSFVVAFFDCNGANIFNANNAS